MFTSSILTPAKIGTMELKNRIIMSPMGTSFPTNDGYATDQLVDYLAERAKGGTALVSQEFSAVHPSGQPPTLACCWDDSFLPGMTKVASAIKANGAKAMIQLAHCGRQTFFDPPNGPVVAASPLPCAGSGTIGKELTEEEIWETIEAYGDAAARAVKAGFDCVEVHCAHGYLIQNFLSPYSNIRTDKWGGSFENRSRFAVEVMRNVRKKVGPDYPVLTRISWMEPAKGGLTLEDQIKFAQLLEKEGSDCIDVSVGVYGFQEYLIPPLDMPHGLNVEAAAEIKKNVNIPVMVVGHINDPLMAANIIDQGKADFVGIGRGLIADPYFVRKMEEGRPDDIVKCIGCYEGCVRNVGFRPMTCTRNPNTGSEKAYELKPVETKKKVLVVGGGAAGLEVATRLHRRGHDVTLAEKTSTLGGQFLLAGIGPNQGEKYDAAVHMGVMAKKEGVNILMQTEVTPEFVKDFGADVVIVATGSVHAKSDIAGADAANVFTAAEVLGGTVTVKNNVVVVGGHAKGCEVAGYLGSFGKKVSIIEAEDVLSSDLDPTRQMLYNRNMEKYGVDVFTGAKCTAIDGDKVVFVKDGKEAVLEGVENVVLATGMTSLDVLSEAVKAMGIETYVIGDAKKVGFLIDATQHAAKLAVTI